jgi:Tol biopolymer transport system component
VSDCFDLIDTDLNFCDDVFVTTVGPPMITVIASPGPSGGGDARSFAPSISGDGRFVAYESQADDLVLPDLDTNGNVNDIFLFDVELKTVRLVSVNSLGFQGQITEVSHAPSLSFDGGIVAFESSMANLVPGDSNSATDVFFKDLTTGEVLRVSVTSSGQQSATFRNSTGASISANGRAVAFRSQAAFVTEDLNGLFDIYVRSPVR